MFDLFRSRDKAVRIVLTALLVLVGLSMVTYLIPSSGLDPTDAPDSTVVATIGKDQLTSQQVAKVIQNMTQSRQLPHDLLAIYVPQMVQQMIAERAMAYEAGRLGMSVSSDETDNAILDSLPPQLIKDGKVDSASLDAVLQQQGVTMLDLKNDTTRQILVNRLRAIVGEGVVISPRDIEDDFHNKNDKTRIQYALVAPAKYQAEAEPSDAEMKAYYDGHKTLFQTPEKRTLAIVLLDPTKTKVTPPTDAQLQKDYTSGMDRFRTPERVDARHILIKSDASNDSLMKAKAEGILKLVQTGGDFAKLAQTNSDDPGSKDKGGELGWLQKGQTVPEFEKSAFTLPVGQTSGLVKTEYGYHIIQVEKHEQAHLQSFDEVKGQLAAEFVQRASTDDLQKMADKAAAEMRKDPLHPEKAADAVGTTVIRAENLQAGDPIPGIGVAKEITDAVSALHKGEIAGPVVFSGNKVAIVSVEDYQAARQATFEEAKTDVRNRASQDKLRKILADKAKELMAKAQAAGGDLEKAGKEMGIEVKTSMDVDRSGAIEGVGSASSISDIFTKPEGGLLGPLVVPTGQLIAKVVLKTPANLADLPKQSEGLRTALKQKKVADRSTMFEEGLKKRLAAEGKLKINQDVLTRLVQNYTSRT